MRAATTDSGPTALDFNSDREVVDLLVRAAQSDPSPDVVEACLSALTFAHHHGMREIVFSTFVQHTKNPHVSVRRELAQCVHWLPDDARLAQIVQALLSDASSEVRKAMAWQACNMSEHKELKELFVQAATMDPDETVRGDALSGIDRLLPLPDVVNLIQQRLPNEPSQAVHWGAFAAMRDHVQEPEARGMIEQLARSPHAQVSRAAREALA